MKTSLKTNELRYIIIGAGPCGLATARNFQLFGIPYIILEKSDNVGGLWDINNSHSTMYESAHLISSKKMTEFHEFPMSDDVPDYPSHHHLQKYFQDYAKHFEILKNIKFNCEVKKVAPLENGNWEVLYNDHKIEAQGVVLATGTLHYPNMPKFEGNYSGEIIHSSKYKSSEIFRGKRVLIVGAGNSGCDIAVDAIHQSVSVDMSLRRGYHFVPKYIFGRPADAMGKMKFLPIPLKKMIQKLILKLVVGDPTRFGFPKPDHKMFESHPIVNSLVLYHAGHGDLKIQKDIKRVDGKKITFIDGVEKEYDLLLLATGYKLKYPYIDEKELNWNGACPKLYLNIFHPKYNNLFVMGMVEALGIGWQGRFDQAELIAKYIKARSDRPDSVVNFEQAKSENNLDLSGGMKYIKLDRMAYYVDKDTYLDQIKKINF